MADAGTERTVKIRFAPPANAIGGIGRDVRPIEHTEWRRQRRPAGKRRALMLRIGMARGAVGGSEQILAALRSGIVSRRMCRGGRHPQAERYYCGIFAR